MADRLKQFELFVLRPLFLILLTAAIITGFTRHWWWLAGSILALFYLGTIGSKLHPLQSASDLASGPLTNPNAGVEAASFTAVIKTALLGAACTRVGILLGVGSGLIFWLALGWRWYLVLPLTWVVLLFSAALLKLAFRAV